MARGTVDFGIDLGTTNSAIAALRGVTTEIIKNNQDADITPSVVGIDKRGALRVGLEAREQMGFDPENAYGEFKRQMGSEHQYVFKRSGVAKKPEELSAEVLKDLRGNVQQRFGEPIDAAVITVPAAFELHQIDATRKAAQLAGLSQSPLLQEPVAAALAYGFQVDGDRAYWLVYDFGGGTFDAAVIKAEEGTVKVINHGGDNFLGGSDIDWALIANYIAPRLIKEHKLKDFSRGNPKWRLAFALLKRSVEKAKIDLSRKDKVWIDECRFQSESGEPIEVDYEISSAELIAAAEPIIERSVEICRTVLKEKKLAPSAIERVVLVGGPTLAPYFRKKIRDQLGIALDYSVDPLTVVARGAAVFAGTQRYTGKPTAAVKGQYVVDLKHKPVGFDSAPLVGGRIAGSKGQSLKGFTVELVASDKTWRSGKIQVSAEGVFTTTLRAERGKRNEYGIVLCDASGQRQITTPDSLTYTVGSVVDEQTLIHSMGLALADNSYDRLLEKGSALPAKAMKTYGSAIALKKGQMGAVLNIPVCEGESTRGDRNQRVGALAISAENIFRDLPKDSDIEVTLQMDASRIILVRAYVPYLDADFETKLDLRSSARESKELRIDAEAEFARLQATCTLAREVANHDAVKELTKLENGALVAELQVLAKNADNADSAAKCEKRLLELRLAIDAVADTLEWPTVVAQAHELSGRLVEEASTSADVSLKKKVENMAADLARIIEGNQIDDLRVKMRLGESLYWQLLFAQPGFWVYQFQEIEKQVMGMADLGRANKLCEQGRAFMSQNNLDGLRNVVRELYKLMPDEAQEELKSGYRAGIVKRDR